MTLAWLGQAYHPSGCGAPDAGGRARAPLMGSPTPALPGAAGIAAAARRYILSIIARPNPEHDTCFAPGINRAKS